MKKLFMLFILLLPFRITVFAQGDLGNGNYLNPILGGDYPDPTIVRDGNDYFMTHSAFDYIPGLTVFHSTNLVNWEPISCALNRYLGHIWAPDICKYKGKYYIYFTVKGDAFSNYVVTADTPYGPWSEPVGLNVGQIDPCHAVGEDGQRWLFLSGGNRIRLSADGLSVVGKLEHVYDGWHYPDEWITEGMALEGPKLKRIGDYYYYLSAEGGTAGAPTSHMIVVARSKSINGPWVNDPNNPLVHTYNNADKWWSRGHGSLIDTNDGRWYVVYHAYENGYYNLGRQTLLEPVYMTDDKWFKAPTGADVDKPIAMPIAGGEKVDAKAHLSEFRIGKEWKFYKYCDMDRVHVSDGVLTLKAKGDNPAASSPMMFVAGVHSYEVSVKVTISPESVAGIVLFYDDQYYVGTGMNATQRLRWRMGALKSKAPREGGNTLWLKIRNDNHVITGYYSNDGTNWIKENWGMEISGYNHNTLYYFQSVLPGLFVYGNGEATFSDFKYKQ
jgi:xylan 1,4-beta-xylosidase